jgi:TP53 regulating kinase-like protein
MATMNTQLVMLSRGAEAEIYLVDFFGVKAVLKKRVSKKYRAPLFDELFIKTRTRTEARVLSELYLSGLKVPGVLFVDEDKGVLILEYIEGERATEVFEKSEFEKLISISREIGRFASVMHSLRIYHGDFTLANIIIADDNVYVIDFGLAGYSDDIEEYAIDLHLMARSIHASKPEYAEKLVNAMLKEYKLHYKGDAEEVISRTKEIRVRGRYVDRELRKAIMRERYID